MSAITLDEETLLNQIKRSWQKSYINLYQLLIELTRINQREGTQSALLADLQTAGKGHKSLEFGCE